MTLGEKLKQQNAERAAREAAAERAKEMKKTAEEKLFLARVSVFLDYVRDSFIERVEAGNAIKPFRIKDSLMPYEKGMRRLLNDPMHPARHVYAEFEKWIESEGLEVEFVQDHDGMGMESWYNLVIRPL
jgi:hypothetical protein